MVPKTSSNSWHIFTKAAVFTIILMGTLVRQSSAQAFLLPLESDALEALAGRAAVGELTEGAGIEVGAALSLRLARNLTFPTIPRAVGERFVIVVNETKFSTSLAEISLNANFSLPVLFADKPAEGVPHEFAEAIAGQCRQGWATLEYKGDEKFYANCGPKLQALLEDHQSQSKLYFDENRAQKPDPRFNLLVGEWQAQIPGNYYQMRVIWDQRMHRFEGFLVQQGQGSQSVGFNLGELVWTATVMTDSDQLREAQEYRMGSNGRALGGGTWAAASLTPSDISGGEFFSRASGTHFVRVQ